MTAVAIRPPVLEWAQRRSGRDASEIRERFVKWDHWLTEEQHPTFSDVEKIANFTRVPVGYLFLTEPPQEELPIPDFRVGRAPPRIRLMICWRRYISTNCVRNGTRTIWLRSAMTIRQGSARDFSVEIAARAIIDALDYGISSGLRCAPSTRHGRISSGHLRRVGDLLS